MIGLRGTIELPEWLADSGLALRTHNRFVKEAVREQLDHHLKHRIDKHFIRSARGRYKYQPRTAKYQSYKIKNRGKTVGQAGQVFSPEADLDLVKSGRTKREIKLGARMTVGGSGNLIRGLLKLKVPIAGSTGRELTLAAQLRLLRAGKLQQLKKRKQQLEARRRLDTVRRTVNEIERFAEDEIKEINQAVAESYAARLSARGKRVKKKLGA